MSSNYLDGPEFCLGTNLGVYELGQVYLRAEFMGSKLELLGTWPVIIGLDSTIRSERFEVSAILWVMYPWCIDYSELYDEGRRIIDSMALLHIPSSVGGGSVEEGPHIRKSHRRCVPIHYTYGYPEGIEMGPKPVKVVDIQGWDVYSQFPFTEELYPPDTEFGSLDMYEFLTTLNNAAEMVFKSTRNNPLLRFIS